MRRRNLGALLASLVISVAAYSAYQYKADSYTAYLLDVDNDNIKDLYLKAKDRLVILGIDVNIPIIYQDSPSLFIKGSSEGSFGTPEVWSAAVDISSASLTDFNMLLGDFNGDGLKDILLQSKNVSTDNVIVYGTTSNSFKNHSFSAIEGSYASADYSDVTIEDVNHDGRDDLILNKGHSNQRVALAQSNGQYLAESQDYSTTSAQKVVGATAGAIDVDTLSGSLSYKLPISMPVGPGGVRPDIGISYNSNSSNGVLGTGFKVLGRSTIYICSKQLGVDGVVTPNRPMVDENNQLTLCMNGQRLVHVDNDASGKSVYRLANDTFKKIVASSSDFTNETSFTAHDKSGDIAEFGVTSVLNPNTKETISDDVFESAYDEGYLKGNSAIQTVSWHLNKKKDQFGNEIEYFYTIEDEHHLLSRIEYGNNVIYFNYEERQDTAFGYSHGIKSKRSRRLNNIEIKVSGKQFRMYDFAYHYAPITNNLRLSSVTECGADNTCFEPTVFEWNDASGEVDFWDRNSSTNFIASGKLCADKNKEYGGCDGDQNYSTFKYADINADGYTDFCFKANDGVRCQINDGNNNFVKVAPVVSSICHDGDKGHGGCNGDNNYTSINFLDFTKDGYPDLVYRSDSGVRIYKNNNGASFTFLTQTSIYPNEKNYDDWRYQTFRYPNLNGDGIPDICYQKREGLMCAWSQGLNSERVPIYGTWWNIHKINGVTTRLCHDDSPSSGCDDGNNYNTVDYADFNGDGLDDLGVRFDRGFEAYISNGIDGFITYDRTDICESSSNDNGGCEHNHSKMTVSYPDANGDGLADVCYRSDIGIRCSYSTGMGFLSNDALSAGDISSNLCRNGDCAHHARFDEGKPHYVTFMDFNGDGKPEFLYRKLNAGVQIHAFTSETTLSASPINSSNICEDGESDCDGSQNHRSINVLDLNSDGAPDLIYKGDSGIKVHNSKLSNMTHADTIKKITNGHGLHQSIEYSTLMDRTTFEPESDSGFYAYNNRSNYLNIKAGKNLVVKSVFTPNSNGTLNELRYRYKGKSANISGYQYSGFRTVEIFKTPTTDLQEYEMKSSIQYSTLHGAFGKPVLTLEYAKNGGTEKLLSKSSTWWKQRLLNKAIGVQESGDVVHNYAYRTDTYRYDENSKLTTQLTTSMYLDNELSSYTLSDYGNVTRQLATTTYQVDGVYYRDEKTLVNKFWSNESAWILGRLEESVATKTSKQLDGTTARSTRKSQWTYYSNGLVKESIIEPDHSTLMVKTAFTYTDVGLKKSETVSGATGLSSTTTYEYENGGRFVSRVTNSLGHTSTTTYHDVLGLATTSTDINGRITMFYYDGFGRLTETIEPFGGTSKMNFVRDYTQEGGDTSYYHVENTTNTGSLSRTYYNKLGDVIRTMSQNMVGQHVYQDTEYFDDGEVSRTSLPYLKGSSPLGWNSVTKRDQRFRVLESQNAAGHTSSIEYNGLMSIATNPKGQKVTTFMNASGSLLKSQSNDGSELQYIYDADGHLVKAIDVASGSVIESSYNQVGNKITTTDPDKGFWQYTYNAMGETVLQINAKGYKTCFAYDPLGRKTLQIQDYKGTESQALNHCNQTNIAVGKATNWYYDTAPKGNTGSKVKGAIHKVVHHTGYSEEYQYDSFARPIGSTRTIKGVSYAQSNSYDIYGRGVSFTYPSGLKIRTDYNNYGYKVAVKNDASGYKYWQANDVDVFGNLIEETFGNGLKSQHWYHQDTGLLDYVVASKSYTTPDNLSAINPVHVMQFGFDNIGNLEWREDARMELYERYTYDNVNRLTTSQLYANGDKITAIAQDTVQYYANGNIKYKPGVGTYTYGAGNAGPHAVTSISGAGSDLTLSYDKNGNMLTDGKRTLIYGNTFDKPVSITHTNGTRIVFEYDHSLTHYYRKDVKGGDITETFNAGSGYEVVTKSGSKNETVYKHYIAGVAIEIHKKEDAAFKQVRYMHTDHLGSVVTITDESGNAVERHAYDAWGQKRTLDWQKINGFDINNIVAPIGEYEAYIGDVDGDKKADLFVRSKPIYIVIAGEIDTTIPVYKEAKLYKGKAGGGFEDGVDWAESQVTTNLTLTKNLPFSSNVTPKGFGGHEHLDGVGLIHMGGRVYDPVLARFMSADPFVQAMTNYQAFNRYSYTLNNPQSYTDPSGYMFEKIGNLMVEYSLAVFTAGAYQMNREKFDHKADQFSDWYREGASNNPEAAQAVGIAGCAAAMLASPYACAAFQAGYTAWLNKDIKKGVKTGAIAAAATWAGGQINANFGGQLAAISLGVLEGAVNVANGGSFGQGYVAGMAAYYLGQDAVLGEGFFASAIIGGTKSAIKAGSTSAFGQGAALGAFAYLVNAGTRGYADLPREAGGLNTNTWPLWRSCDNGDAAACLELKAINTLDLEDGLEFIKANFPELVKNTDLTNPNIKFRQEREFVSGSEGRTYIEGLRIDLSAAYGSKQHFISALAHELGHRESGKWGIVWSGVTDVFSIGRGYYHENINRKGDEVGEAYAKQFDDQ